MLKVLGVLPAVGVLIAAPTVTYHESQDQARPSTGLLAQWTPQQFLSRQGSKPDQRLRLITTTTSTTPSSATVRTISPGLTSPFQPLAGSQQVEIKCLPDPALNYGSGKRQQRMSRTFTQNRAHSGSIGSALDGSRYQFVDGNDKTTVPVIKIVQVTVLPLHDHGVEDTQP